MDHEWGGEKTKADLYKTISLLTTPVLQLLHKDMKRILLIENFAWRQNIVKEKVVMNLEGYYERLRKHFHVDWLTQCRKPRI